MAQTLLKVSNLKVAYGGIQAVKGVSFEVQEGELVSLIGANGAGKTSVFNTLSGFYTPASGRMGCRSMACPSWNPSPRSCANCGTPPM